MTKHWFSFQNLRYCERFQYLINWAPHRDNDICNYSLLVEILDTIDQNINVIHEINENNNDRSIYVKANERLANSAREDK